MTFSSLWKRIVEPTRLNTINLSMTFWKPSHWGDVDALGAISPVHIIALVLTIGIVFSLITTLIFKVDFWIGCGIICGIWLIVRLRALILFQHWLFICWRRSCSPFSFWNWCKPTRSFVFGIALVLPPFLEPLTAIDGKNLTIARAKSILVFCDGESVSFVKQVNCYIHYLSACRFGKTPFRLVLGNPFSIAVGEQI